MKNSAGANKRSQQVHTVIQVERESRGITAILPLDYGPTSVISSNESTLEDQVIKILDSTGPVDGAAFRRFCNSCFSLVKMNEVEYVMNVNSDERSGTDVSLMFRIKTCNGIKILVGKLSMNEISEKLIPEGVSPAPGIIRYMP